MPLMQRHVDIYRHKVIMGIHSRLRKDKFGADLMPLSPKTQDLTTSGRDRTIINDEGLDRDMDDHISMTGLSAADL